MTSQPELELEELRPPVISAWRGEITGFLRHKGSPWIEDISRRLRGRVPGAEDHFYVFLDDANVVAHAWYTVSRADPRLGLVGHIYTHPEWRRRGIARQLMRTLMTDFRARGGQVMQLFTSTPYSVELYQQEGFENVYSGQVYHDTDWYMRYPTPCAPLLTNWFQSSDVSIRKLRYADLPQYCLLYNQEPGAPLKDWVQRVGLGLEAEFAFLQSIAASKRGDCTTCVLDNGQTIVGIASVARVTFPYQSHVGLFDLHLHSAYLSQASKLARACFAACAPYRLEWLYALSVDPDKRRLLDDLGFTPCGLLADHYRVGTGHFDCELLRLPLTPDT